MLMGIDPGRRKCGVAILNEAGEVLQKQVVDTSNLSKVIEKTLNDYSINKCILGNGTYADKIFNILQLLIDEKKIKFIEEENSTFIAEQRYLKENPPFGIKFLNKIFRIKPKRPLDDYTAVVLVEKYLNLYKE
ncbi:MAG: Holliday junction resolvase RuvX [Halanaerobiales bacterium]|nr:Holliday junction resolvase RuvX [Halanaerobiales bacterium]